jgi:uridine phosphorylase
MPAQLRPTAPIAADAILVGDPGRALMLAQELLEEPKMSNHARGLWGYSGRREAGGELTIQATGMGGPSAAVVLADLAELGVRRVVRVGTCVALDPRLESGELLVVTAARAEGGSGASFGVPSGEAVQPDDELTGRLKNELTGEASAAAVASFDAMPAGSEPAAVDIAAADMQTVAVLARARSLGIAAAAILVVVGAAGGADQIADAALEAAAKRAGGAASSVLSPSR